MKILPVKNDYYKPHFKGKIHDNGFLKSALTHFSDAELKEYNALKAKMAKVNDGLTYTLAKGTQLEYNESGKQSYYYRTIQLTSTDTNNKIIFYNREIYSIEIGKGVDTSQFASDNKAFVRAILEPLRNIYK